jgi:hypothetical protein
MAVFLYVVPCILADIDLVVTAASIFRVMKRWSVSARLKTLNKIL